MERLKDLSTLYIQGNKIGNAGAQRVSALKNLKLLHAQGNAIGAEGAQALAGLVKLKSLSLAKNNIGPDGARALASLKSLTTLHLDDNKIGPTATALGDLASLTMLDISRTGVTDFSFLKSLTKLRALYLNGLSLKTEDADQLNRQGLALYLCKAKLGDFPPEALSKNAGDDCMPRLRKHIEARKQDDKPNIEVRDVKVMLLGNGTVGKTQLRRRLKDENYDEEVDSTHGVEIVRIELPPEPGASKDAPPTPLQVWDFGGQDMYLGTHALFMKTRAVFPVLWTPASEANEFHYVKGVAYRNRPVNELLRYVRQLAGEKSPVLLIQSRCESDTDRDDREFEQAGRFAKAPYRLRYSAKLDEPKGVLLGALRDAVKDLGEPQRISARWNRVKAAVEDIVKRGDQQMTRAEFNKICTKEKVTDPEAQLVLLKMLHEFGTVFYDEQVLGELIVLDQNWALGAIYAVFDRDHGTYARLQSLNGRFTRTDLEHLAWNQETYSVSDQEAFIAMMVACKAAFELRPRSDTHGEALYVAPDLLPDRRAVEPRLARYEAEAPDASREFHFAFALPSMLRELMGRWAEQAGQEGVYWQEGLWFKKSKSFAIVEAQRLGGDRSWAANIRIRVWRGNASRVVEELSEQVIEIADRFEAQPVANTEDLLDLPARNEEEDADSDGATWSDHDDLDEFEPAPTPRCFISYAWGGPVADDSEDTVKSAINREKAFTRVEARLRALGIEPFFDRERLRHGESISEFIATAANQERFVIILSKKYLQSDYCMDELIRIYRNCRSNAQEFRTRVRAVLLDDAQIDTLTERDRIASYWAGQRVIAQGVLHSCKEEERPPESTAIDILRISYELALDAATILSKIKDAYPIRGINDIDKLAF